MTAGLEVDTGLHYMAPGAALEIATALISAGKPRATPVALVESASLPEERHLLTTLGALATEALPRAEGPVVLCVGEVFRDAAATEEASRRIATPQERIA